MPIKSRAYPASHYEKTHYRHASDGIPGDSPDLNRERRFYISGAERIVYTNRRGYTNPCDHYRLRGKPNLGTFTGTSPVGFNEGRLTTYVNETWAATAHPSYPISFISPSLHDFQRKFVGSGEAGLTTFLGEIGDVKELLTSTLKLLRGGFNLRELPFRGPIKKAIRKGRSGLTPTEAFLEANLGLLPFVSDIKSLFKVATGLENRLRRLENLSRTGKVVRVQFVESEVGREESSPILYNHCTNRIYSSYSITKRASCYARLSLPSPSLSNLDKNRATAEFLGLEYGAKNFWDLVPFTFVLDYFGNFSQVIDDYSTTFLDGNIELWDFSQSCKVIAHGEAVITRDPILGGVLEGVSHSTSDVVHYVRQPYLANQFQSFSLGELDLKQAAIVTNLLAGK